MKAIWNDVVLADSVDVVSLEGNKYFPMDSLTCGSTKISPNRTIIII